MFGDDQVDGYEDGNEPLGFHHKNGEYRKNEPQFAQDIGNGVNQPKRGFFRVLVSTRGNRSIFFIMCVTFAIIIFVNIFAKNPDECVVNGVDCNITSFSFEDKVYVSVELKKKDEGKSKKNKSDSVELASPKKVQAKFFLYNTDKAEAVEKGDECVFTGETTYIRETFEDYDIAEVKCVITSADDNATITSKVQAR